MGSWLVFCTADIPSETQSITHKSAPPAPWILQQTPSEGVHGPELSLPPPSFTTGFKDASPTTIQTFIKENLEGRHEFPDFGGAIEWDEFVILDERSVKDNTCLVYHRTSRMPEGSYDVDWDKEKLIYEWQCWRVKFLVAWGLIAELNFADDVVFSIWEDKKDAYWDEHGVFQLPYLEEYTHP
ncbi:Amino acid permease protein [Rutstroemia sp. NJR-2017a BBW]|nr:Amino acid permease protein [Rutstroemia sp. NJR-2017a BBW]